MCKNHGAITLSNYARQWEDSNELQAAYICRKKMKVERENYSVCEVQGRRKWWDTWNIACETNHSGRFFSFFFQIKKYISSTSIWLKNGVTRTAMLFVTLQKSLESQTMSLYWLFYGFLKYEAFGKILTFLINQLTYLVGNI